MNHHAVISVGHFLARLLFIGGMENSRTIISCHQSPFDIMVLAGFDDGSTQSLEAFLPQSNGLDDVTGMTTLAP
jgi:hypothetical protein